MENVNIPARPDLWIRVEEIRLPPPSLRDNTADLDRLLKGIRKSLGTEHIVCDLSIIKRIPSLLREFNYSVKAALFRDGEVWNMVDLFSSEGEDAFYGFAVDLGTTTIVMEMVDIKTGKTVDRATFHNPQIQAGADILSRIHFTSSNGNNLRVLQSLVTDRINVEFKRMAASRVTDPSRFVAMSVAGNTTMTHLFLGITPYWICREPYIPAANRFDGIRASSLGLDMNPLAPVLVFPNVGSYFGGDLIAGIMSSGMTETDEVSLLVDVGTNAEVVIGNSEWLMACAGAAGPALEGGVASMGMIAGPGVIDRVRIEPHGDRFVITTIGNERPVGICGSGLIDLVSELFLAGMIDIRGKFIKEQCKERLQEKDGVAYFILVEEKDSGTGTELTLSQPDIDALIRSKAAMYTILTTITNTVNVPLHSIKTFYVAGTFGSYIDPRSAITIGMLPDLPLSAYVSLGNTSLMGARKALISKEAAVEALRIRDRITYLELNVNQEFMNLFSAAKFLPHTDRALFPSVKERRPGSS
ncbi:MAG: DUF4445 domain-containing protein [Desulfobacteraceae bacterium]|nr:MAG: DUF4445 domain-containing protein [Desulfobacteraceae bacterium]